jgi:hypothetical protein
MQNASDSDPLSYFQVAGQFLPLYQRAPSYNSRYPWQAICFMEQFQPSSRCWARIHRFRWLLHSQYAP